MLDEFYIEELVKKKFPLKSSYFPTGIGDDSAIVKVKSNKIVVSCDSQVEGVHFDLNYMTPSEIAFRSISVAISDLSAMGAKPRFFSNSLFLPKKTSKSFIENLFKGFKKGSDFYNILLIGGNVSKAKSLIIDITVFGEVHNKNYKERLKNNSGDLLYVSGKIGDASIGMHILKKKKKVLTKHKSLISKFKTPHVNVNLGLFLGQLSYVTSMIDITDGLSLDLRRLIGTNRKKGARINWEDIPKSDFAKTYVTNSKFINSIISGGDDYELLFTINKNKEKVFEDLCKKKNFQVHKIGYVDLTGKLSLSKGGKIFNLPPKGFIHKF